MKYSELKTFVKHYNKGIKFLKEFIRKMHLKLVEAKKDAELIKEETHKKSSLDTLIDAFCS